MLTMVVLRFRRPADEERRSEQHSGEEQSDQQIIDELPRCFSQATRHRGTKAGLSHLRREHSFNAVRRRRRRRRRAGKSTLANQSHRSTGS